MNKGANIFKSIKAFTLMEVLVVLGVIGVIYALTIQPLINNIQTQSYKTAYQKAEADGEAAFIAASNDNTIVPLPTGSDSIISGLNWQAFKAKFIVTQSCESNNGNLCWNPTGEKAFTSQPWTGNYSFIDNKGRAWSMYDTTESIILVDTNGLKGPNQYGKDRWLFAFTDSSNNRSGTFTRFSPMFLQDYPAVNTDWCPSGGCYYLSWLTGAN